MCVLYIYIYILYECSREFISNDVPMNFPCQVPTDIAIAPWPAGPPAVPAACGSLRRRGPLKTGTGADCAQPWRCSTNHWRSLKCRWDMEQ